MAGVELYRTSPGPYKGRPQGWRFRFRANNNSIIVTGKKSYTNRDDAVDAIRLVFGEATTFSEPVEAFS